MRPWFIRTKGVPWMAALVTLIIAAVGPEARAAGMLVAEGGFGGRFEIKSQEVRVTVNNGIAVTEVDQVFLNKENRIAEALYTFPVPKGASVSDFTMWIEGQPMVGEVLEKKRAREVYESYKQTRRDPGLLEQVDYKRFEMRVFPIAAGGEQRIRLVYAQELDFNDNWATYVYPLATTLAGPATQRTTGRFALTLDVKSEVPIEAVESPSHRDGFAVAKRTEHYAQASMEVSGGDLSRDVVLAVRTSRPRTGLDLVASRAGDEDGHFLLTFTAGEELEDVVGGSDYVFVVDISGSMMGERKLDISRESVAAFVEALGEADRFELLAFNIDTAAAFRALKPANADSRARAARFLDSREARGGTQLRPALEAAYRYHQKGRTLNVVVLSDGLTEPGDQTQLVSLIRSRPAGSRVFCVGVGNDVNRPLLEQLATDAGGLAAFASAQDDFARHAKAFHRKLTRPAATDVKLSFDGGGVYDLEPAVIPNLYIGAPVRVYGRYRKPGKVGVRIEAKVLGRDIDKTLEVELPHRDDANPQVDRMWACRRVQSLLDESRRSGAKDAHVPEIVRLCEGYSIVSEYASFIVLENDAEYQRWRIERRNASRITRDQRAQTVLREELDRLRSRSQPGPRADGVEQFVVASADPAPAGTSARASDVASSPSQAPTGPAQAATPSVNALERDDGSTGGGAIDPISGAFLLLTGAGAMVATRRRAI